MKRTRYQFVAWPGLIVGCVVLEAVYLPALNARTEPSRAERVNALLIAQDADTDGLATYWNARKGENIKVVTPLFYSRNTASLSYIFSSLSSTQDTFLLPSSFLTKESTKTLMATFLSLPGNNQSDYQINGVSYGILAFSHESKEDGLLSSYISYKEGEKAEDDYYIFFHRDSKHVKSYRSKAIDDEALMLWSDATKRGS